jgi:septum formation protein
MLVALRGREHFVHSGLCVWRRPDDAAVAAVETTRLVMDRLSDNQLLAYLDTGDWAGKAGAFGYQDDLDWVHIIEGSESNVVGLPLELLAQLLDKLTDPMENASREL